jgi:acyl-coenzyme A synthetase/AMP-(fatty) acid ligase
LSERQANQIALMANGVDNAHARALPLLQPADPARPIAFRHGAPVLLAQFERHVAAVSARLPRGSGMVNLCEDRYRFLVAYAAAAGVGHTVLLPPSRAEQIVAEVQRAYAGSYRLDDELVEAALSGDGVDSPCSRSAPADHTVMIGFTSGSTGEPKRFPKLWGGVHASTARNVQAIRAALSSAADGSPGHALWVLATVPPQHMYGMELSVLLPLIGGVAVHAARPLFPADVAAALAELPSPRALVSTPVHLRALIESPQALPQVDLIICATAPLDQALAQAVERKLGGHLLEMFGSTETCVFASRRTAHEQAWRLYPGVTLTSEAEGTLVDAPGFAAPVLLQDLVEMQSGDRFVVRGRNSDMVEVAGKRASLGDLTRRVLAVEGVQDAVLFQSDAGSSGAIRRIAALVVAPGLTSATILERLAPSVDPAFLPRPLVLVEALPRNEVGKLPRERLLDALRRGRG